MIRTLAECLEMVKTYATNIAQSKGRGHVDVDTVVSNSMERVWLLSLRDNAWKSPAYVRTMVRNILTDEFRKANTSRTHEKKWAGGPKFRFELETQEVFQRLHDQLSPEERETLELLMEGTSIKNISRKLHEPYHPTRRRIIKLKEKVGKCLLELTDAHSPGDAGTMANWLTS